ncbi:MAG: Band 7 protein [Candidatus Nomurabacteria bacterium GW2011_GWB1_40_7]|uniref:Band 7 protein n=1 Tax=Candidatus Nomurabacteria bacterium GW2011_GWB1_40_7 TaxID=1618744 RepID=A0A0G0SZF7_9BACT|nr:MAG: Band 7 protein [Candidatus Nomurabacteria bacterium GW2011_GWB1_40_7]
MSLLFSSINWWVVASVVVICYFASSVKIVSEKEMGLSKIWGLILKSLKSGPHFIPWPMTMIKVTKNAIKVDFGTLDVADVERVNKANASQSWFVMTEPIRINWGDIESSSLPKNQRKQYENDPLAKRVITDPHLYYILRVFNLQNLVEEAGGLIEAIDRIRDTCTTALQEFAGKTFLAKAITEVEQLSNDIRERVEDLVGDEQGQKRAKEKGITLRSWGVDVMEVRIKAFGTSHAVNTAVSERSALVAKAAGEAISTELKAGAEEIRLTKEGKGLAAAITAKGAADASAITIKGAADASAITAKGTAEASAISARAKAVTEPGGELILKTDTLKEGLAHGKTVVLPLDQSLLTTVTSIKTVLDAVGKKED